MFDAIAVPSLAAVCLPAIRLPAFCAPESFRRLPAFTYLPVWLVLPGERDSPIYRFAVLPIRRFVARIFYRISFAVRALFGCCVGSPK